MEERTKQIMRRYLIREFDELNVVRSPDFQTLDREEVKEQIRQYIEESYEDGHEGVFYMLGLAAFAVSRERMEKAVYHKIDGKTFEDSIDELFDSGDFEPYELERIAVTEGHRAYVDGQEDAAEDIQEETGVTIYKRWDATMDDKTRQTHRLLNGQIRLLDELFTTVNGSAQAPGQFGVAKEDINCRCILTFTSY